MTSSDQHGNTQNKSLTELNSSHHPTSEETNFTKEVALAVGTINIVTAIGTIFTIWEFGKTLYFIGTSPVDLSLYLYCIILVSSFLFLFYIATKNTDGHSMFVIFLSIAYAVLFSSILLMSYFVSVDFLIEFGLDIGTNPSSESSGFFSSRSIFSTVMFFVILVAANHFVSSLPNFIGIWISSIIITTLTATALYSIDVEIIRANIRDGFDFNEAAGYIIFLIITVGLARFATTPIKKSWMERKMEGGTID
jgi:hypothetical protein